ncbi:serine/threonine-protein kinase [Actinoplanes couchii]|uniref:non-specific serine/threonine protein kinase n=2 Tax=Actinoplanes couchii TaxID=403638 RepID=A0ABQ3XTE2_9ACTN|nr:serine/threonine protein kinase [Actinoplanes couchii]
MIGRYRITGRLGSGAFATVWLAEDDVLESRVAIKILAENWAHHPDVRARFEQEAQVLRRADSERLVRVHDFGELPDGRPYQVMTYAAGGTLQDRLDQGPMPVRTALRTAGDIAHAVSVLHDSGVLHRDLKPSNVLFDTVRGTERVLVADLGLAKEIAHASGFTVVAGTPGYMAPEQHLPGGGLDVRADVHAIGAMTYQMLTGQPPQSGRAAGAAPSKLRSGISREVDRVVMRALDADRDRRWPSTAAFATALEASTSVSPSRILRLARNTVGTALALSLLALTGGATVPNPTPVGWVRVADPGRAVSVSVPGGWAGQLRDSGWNVAAVGLPAATEPGLQISADLDSNTAPGLFAGRLPPGGSPTVPTHPGCIRLPDRTVRALGTTGLTQRWTSCGGDTVSYDEVVLPGVYLQIRQDSRGPDHTDGILRTLRVRD